MDCLGITGAKFSLQQAWTIVANSLEFPKFLLFLSQFFLQFHDITQEPCNICLICAISVNVKFYKYSQKYTFNFRPWAIIIVTYSQKGRAWYHIILILQEIHGLDIIFSLTYSKYEPHLQKNPELKNNVILLKDEQLETY